MGIYTDVCRGSCETNLLSLDVSYCLASAYSFINPSYKKSRAVCTLSCECQGFSFPPTCPRHHDETFGFQVPQTDAHIAFVASHNGGSGEEGAVALFSVAHMSGNYFHIKHKK